MNTNWIMRPMLMVNHTVGPNGEQFFQGPWAFSVATTTQTQVPFPYPVPPVMPVSEDEEFDTTEKFIWALVEPFHFACFPITPSPKLSIQLLNKIMSYARNNNLFPFLSLKPWLHICRNKLEYSENFAWTYLRVFDVMQQQMLRSDGEPGYWDGLCDTIRQNLSDKNKAFKVSTLGFMLFLYIQHSYSEINSAKGRSTATESEDIGVEWQTDWFYPPQREENYILDEQEQHDFIKAHIEEIIRFLQLYDSSCSRVSGEIVTTLNLILGGTVDSMHSSGLCKIEQFLLFDDVRQLVDFRSQLNAGYTVDRHFFVEWIKSVLRLNILGSQMCFGNENRCTVRTGICDHTVTDEFNRCCGNDQPPPHEWFFISQVNDQVLCNDDVGMFSNLKVHRCNNSFIYVPGVFNYVSIEKCYKTTIYLGCVAKILKVVDCTEIVLVGQGRQVMIHDAFGCKFSFHTPCPIFLSGCLSSKLVFGPYSTFYPKLQEHMDLAHLGPEPSLWSSVLGVADQDGCSLDVSHLWEKLGPDTFCDYVYPFSMIGDTKVNPVPLPDLYADRKQEVKTFFHQWKKSLDSSDIDTMDRRIINDIMYERFKEFLQENNFDCELDALLSLMSEEDVENTKSVWPIPDADIKSYPSDKCRARCSASEFETTEDSGSDVTMRDSGSDIDDTSDDEDSETDVFTEIEEAFRNNMEHNMLLQKQVEELMTRPLSADFDASGDGIDDIRFDFFGYDFAQVPPQTR